MSLFDDPPPDDPVEAPAPEPVPERPPLHYAKDQNLKPVCGTSGHATVLPSLVTCPACLSRQKAAERPSRPVYRRDGLCQACSATATDGEFCAHHAGIVAAASAKATANAAALAPKVG